MDIGLYVFFIILPFATLVALSIYADSISKDLNESDEQEGEE